LHYWPALNDESLESAGQNAVLMSKQPLKTFIKSITVAARDIAPPRDASGCHYGICSMKDCGRCQRAKAFHEAVKYLPEIENMQKAASELSKAAQRFNLKAETAYQELTDSQFGKLADSPEGKDLKRALADMKWFI
jgi:hypothetical protein